MHLPYLRSRKQKTEKQTVVFRGVNYGEGSQDGQLENSRNVTSERFPCLSPRAGRSTEGEYENATAVYYKNGQFVVNGTELLYNGEVIGAVSPGKKQFASINTKVVIMPDKIMFDTKTRELRSLGAEYTSAPGAVVFTSGGIESRLTTHIGGLVEVIAGSGNVGGNDALGKKNPIFMLDTPFSKVYASGKVNEEVGGFDLGEERTGEGMQARNLAIGNVFTEPSLGADGVKRFGRITGATMFPESKYQDGATYYTWERYKINKSAVTTISVKENRADNVENVTPISHSTIKGINYDLNGGVMFWTGTSGGTLHLVCGNSVYIDTEGYFQIGDATKISYRFSSHLSDAKTVTVGPFDFSGYGSYTYDHVYFGIVDADGKIRSYIKMYVRNRDANDDAFGESMYFELRFAPSRVYVEDSGLYEQFVTATFNPDVMVVDMAPNQPTYSSVESVAASKDDFEGMSYSTANNTYPENGIAGEYWYEYLGAVTNPCYYGFDYDLFEAKDADGVSGFSALNFYKGDTVEISGCTTLEGNNISATIRDIAEEAVDGVTKHSLIFDGNLFQPGTEAGAITISRKAPNLSVICESNNRLWGAESNTIFASALGDPTNFYTYDGLDTDSYAVAVASEGAFTGCCGFGNSVLFWKEDKLHKILGAYPSQYTMYEYNVPGVKRGSENSLVNVNEVIYYHGREGVYRYNGGSPELISENFGLRRFQEAAAGAEGDRYYISMQDVTSKEWGLWVYDILRGIWLQEDESQGMDFAYNEGKLYYISGDGGLMCVNPEESDEVVAWSATTTRMDEVFHNRKCYSKLLLRAELLEDSAWLQVDISCDGEPFKRVYTSRDKRSKTLVIPIMPKRCDSFRIRLSGEGKFILRSLVREFGIGSEY